MRRIFVFSPIILLMFLAITGCNANGSSSSEKVTERQSDTLDVDTMKKIVEGRNLVYDKAFVDGDSVTVMEHFTEDARLFPPNEEQVIGKTAIAPLISQFLKYGIKKFTDETIRVIDAGGYIMEEGNYFLGGDKGTTLDKGKYICIWKKDNGQWRVCSNMWNTNLPLASEKK